jgi:hypothetical protein
MNLESRLFRVVMGIGLDNPETGGDGIRGSAGIVDVGIGKR